MIPQLFKGAFYYCEGPNIKNVRNRTDCEADSRNVWINRKYNFDDLGKALMSLFVLSSRDGWVNIMYTGLDAVGVDQQVSTNSADLLHKMVLCLSCFVFILKDEVVGMGKAYRIGDARNMYTFWLKTFVGLGG